MEAKDTIMTGKQIDAEMDRIEKLDTSYTSAEFELCKAQAKISFAAGLKELVEWMKTHQMPDNPSSEPYPGLIVISKSQLEAKLEELGLESERVRREG